MKKVAVVEDSLVVRKLLSTILRNAGYEVIECSTEAEGKSLGAVDIAILDYMLPDGNGLNVARYLKMKNPGIVMILLTARSEKIDPREVEISGVQYYLQKPVEPDKILDILRNTLK
jgi:DNA-binding response OmpR family regulator